MASSRRPLLLPLLLALAVSLAPSLSTQGSAFARSISASDVSDGDIDRFVNAGASNEEDSIAMAVPGAEEHVRRSLQSQKVSCDQNSILVTYRIISDQGNGTMVIQLIIKNLCPYDVIGRLIFWNCQMDTIYAAGNTNFQTGKLLFKAVAYIPPAGGLGLSLENTVAVSFAPTLGGEVELLHPDSTTFPLKIGRNRIGF